MSSHPLSISHVFSSARVPAASWHSWGARGKFYSVYQEIFFLLEASDMQTDRDRDLFCESRPAVNPACIESTLTQGTCQQSDTCTQTDA